MRQYMDSYELIRFVSKYLKGLIFRGKINEIKPVGRPIEKLIQQSAYHIYRERNW